MDRMPRMTMLAPVVDRLQELADEHVPRPHTFEIVLWDDGDYRLTIWHAHGQDIREQLVYDTDTGGVNWQRTENPFWEKVAETADGPTEYVSEYEEFEEREIATINPPV